MYAEVAWALVFSGTQVQLQTILDPDYLPDYLSIFYDYDFTDVKTEKQSLLKRIIFVMCSDERILVNNLSLVVLHLLIP